MWKQKGCRISSGAVTMILIPCINYYISLSDPAQALKYKSCSYEDQSFMTQKNGFWE